MRVKRKPEAAHSSRMPKSSRFPTQNPSSKKLKIFLPTPAICPTPRGKNRDSESLKTPESSPPPPHPSQ